MSGSPSQRPRRLRIAALILGLILILWLPIEDASIVTVLLFGAAISLLGAVAILSGLAGRGKLRWMHFPIAGLVAGLLVAPLAGLLIVFKIGLHGHDVPDFSLQQVETVFRRTPFWGLGGLMVGLGLGVWRWVGENES